ncbi:MAG: hypothetical protein AAFR76_03710 [Planctomycetota bacterium]
MAKKPALPQQGTLWAIPTKVGFFRCIVTRVPSVKTQFPTCYCYVHAELVEELEMVREIPPLGEWGACWHGFVGLRPFKAERWKPLGPIENFDSDAWPIPADPCKRGWDDDEPYALAAEVFADDGSMRLLACCQVDDADADGLCEIQMAPTPAPFEKALVDSQTGRRPGAWDGVVGFEKVDAAVVDRWRRTRASLLASATHRDGEVYTRQVEEGDLIEFPMQGGGYGVLLVARAKPDRQVQSLVLLGLDYWSPDPFDADAVETMGESRVVRSFDTNSWECRYGRWRPIGIMPGYSRDSWPIPPITRDAIEVFSDPMDIRTRHICSISDVSPDFPDHAMDAYAGPYDGDLVRECERWGSLSFPNGVEGYMARWRHSFHDDQDPVSKLREEIDEATIERWRRLRECLPDATPQPD